MRHFLALESQSRIQKIGPSKNLLDMLNIIFPYKVYFPLFNFFTGTGGGISGKFADINRRPSPQKDTLSPWDPRWDCQTGIFGHNRNPLTSLHWETAKFFCVGCKVQPGRNESPTNLAQKFTCLRPKSAQSPLSCWSVLSPL